MHLLALTPRRARVSVGGPKQIAQVEVHVTGGGGMDVDMHQPRARKRMPQRQTRLLRRLSHRRLAGRLARVEVTTRLQPDPEPFVPVQDRATRADDDRGTGDVHRPGEAVEGPR